MFTEVKSTNFQGTRERAIPKYLNRFGRRDGFSIVDSGQDSYVFLEPVLKIWGDSNGSYVRDHRGLSMRFEGSWEAFEKEVVGRINSVNQFSLCPCVSGYFAYEFLHQCETVNHAEFDETKSPFYVFYFYKTVLKLSEGRSGSGELFHFAWDVPALWEISEVPSEYYPIDFVNEEALSSETGKLLNPKEIAECLEEFSNFSKQSYLRAVENIKDLIRDGEVYQVNLSQQFLIPYFERPERFANLLRKKCPAAHGAYLSVRSMPGFESFQIISASPELFFHSDGKNIQCSPIKGTRPRGANSDEDILLASELNQSEKDHAELAMIVDLVRNDLGRVAKIGTVKVDDHARLESHPNVHHLVSDVSCELAEGVSLLDIIRSVFPCGSITGAPKIAAMKVISKMENTTRGAYTGAIGMLGTKGFAEFNVAIRTAILREGYACINSGGGIVIDSDAEQEYYETMVKVSALYQALCLACEISEVKEASL